MQYFSYFALFFYQFFDTAEELCDKIGIINNGTLLIEGKPQDLIELVDAKDLEDAYLKILRISRNKNVLSWR